MTTPIVKQVLIDLDNDGWINEGVPVGTPSNIFPRAPFTTGSYLRGLQYTTEDDVFLDEQDISEQGLMKRSVQMGHDVDGDYGETLRMGFSDYYNVYQRHLSDPENLIPNSVTGDYGMYIAPTLTLASSSGKFGRKMYHNGAAVNSRFIIGLDYNTGGVHGKYEAVGYHDVPEEYSKADDGIAPILTPTWQGLPVVAGQTYTISYHLVVTNGTGSTLTHKTRIYGDSATLTSPNFGRVYLAGADTSIPSVGPVEVHIVETFTVPVGTTQIAIDCQMASALSTQILIGGLMLFDGTVVPSDTRTYDAQTAYGDSQFAVLLEANKAYILTFWAKSADGIDLLEGTLGTGKLGEGYSELEDSHSLTITSSWQRFNFTLPSRNYIRGFGFEWVTEKGGLPTGLDNVGTIEFKGFMLVEGSSPTPYQVGPLAAYDNITSYVLSLDTKSGKDDFLEPLAYEGTANITLNNASRLFSPKNTDSPLYEYLIQDLKVVIKIDGASIWQGWVTEYEITPGLWEERQVTLSCQQGMYRLNKSDFTAAVRTDVRIDELAREVIENSGWKPTGNPYFSVLGYNALLDDTFYLNDSDASFSRIDEGVNILEITGMDWDSKTTIDHVLRELLSSESATLWIDRNGQLVLSNRLYWVDRPVDKIYNIDTTSYLTRAEYRYGQDMINRVQITRNAKKQTLDTPVWKTYRAIYVPKNQNRSVEISPKYQEGRSRTVVSYTLEGATKEAYYSDPGMTYEELDTASSEDTNAVVLELFPDVGNRYRLRITNRGTRAMWIDVELNGDYLETGDETPITFEDTQAIQDTGAVHFESYTTGVLSRETEARSMALFPILRTAYPDGEFRSLEFTVATQELLDPLLETELGHIIHISEGQTGEVLSPHAVIAEEFSINGGTVTVTFILARIERENYVELDATPLNNSTVNLIADMSNMISLSEGETGVMEWPYEGLTEILYWNIQGTPATQLLLNPAPNQYQTFLGSETANAWPELTAASVSTLGNRTVTADYKIPFPAMFVRYEYDEETNEFIPNSDKYTNVVTLKAALAGIDWRLTYGAELSGVTKQGDTIFKALAKIPVKRSSSYTAYVNMTEATYTAGATDYAMRVHGSNDTLASGLGTSAAGLANSAEIDFNTGANDHIAFSFLGKAGASTLFEMGYLALLQRSNVNNPALKLDTTVTHKYTLYCKIDPKQTAKDMTLTVYGVDGTALGTQTLTVGYTLTKFEITIPTGANSKTVYAILSYPSSHFAVDEALWNVYIYAHGITQASVSSFLDLITPATQKTLYI